ncbi:hypothetical protein [Streptomyces sp. NBC_01455]|uniref:hypothetical protein n=1 Tax=Streptomyces sp. NBC_01455 TaxID=2903874 RepID=UPI002E313FCA|nr:hypothetical protein [Streptomyces sp. NBC_01455]
MSLGRLKQTLARARYRSAWDKEAVVTFFQETYHQNRMTHSGDTGTEDDAAELGQMTWR